MKKSVVLISFICSVFALMVSGCAKKSSGHDKVVVYTYDSFMSEWGPGPELQKLFKEKTGLDVEFVDCGDGVQILSRAILEKNSPQADVLVGIDNNLVKKALAENILAKYKPQNADDIIIPSLKSVLGDEWFLTPFDWSHFAMIYDTHSNVAPPKSLKDLTDPVYAKKIILMDPRTSTPGLGFFAWTVAVFGEKYLDFWKNLKPNILTVAPGWSAGYSLFTSGEAPLVVSYTTSPAYHVEYDKTDRFKALTFDEGHCIQVEGAGIVKNAPNLKGAKLFMDFLISDEAQNVLPLTQWMYPSNKNLTLPECYQSGAVIPSKTISADSSDVETAVEKVMALLSQ